MKRNLTIPEARLHASEMRRKSGKPDSYYWSAVWWRLSAKESKNPAEQISYSRAQMALYKDMLQRPRHYADTLRPVGMSDWLWSGLATSGSN